MKAYFPGHYRPTEDEFLRLWRDGIFALDANVLLNLYRYPKKASGELLRLLSRDPEKYWIPFQAALEFQLNRLGVIAEQKRKFDEVREVIEAAKSKLVSGIEGLQLKKRHSSINADAFLGDFSELVGNFISKLDPLEEAQPAVHEDDSLRAQLDVLLDTRVGAPPSNQGELDEIYKDGALRFAARVPPGFQDEGKGKSADAQFSYGGLYYQRQFGDLVLWKQLISHARDNELKCVVLVTDDEKRDWWWIVESHGAKTIGPRPELVEEMRRLAGVELFYVYNSEQFLSFARKHLAAEVSEESIEQVREVSSVRQVDIVGRARMLESIIAAWLRERYPAASITATTRGFPDFIVFNDGQKPFGVDTLFVTSPVGAILRLRDRVYRAYFTIEQEGLSEVHFLLALPSQEALEEAEVRIRRSVELPPGVTVIGGTVIFSEERPRFREGFRVAANAGQTKLFS